jgi:hypothetical protein
MNEDDAVSRDAAPWVSLLDDDAKIVTSRLGPGRFRIAGTAVCSAQPRGSGRRQRTHPPLVASLPSNAAMLCRRPAACWRDAWCARAQEFNGYNRDIRHDRIMPLVRWCNTHFPSISTEDITPWSGLRPMMPSMLPRVGAGRHPGVFYNTGHGHLGWTLSAATAEMIGETVRAGATHHHARSCAAPPAVHPPAVHPHMMCMRTRCVRSLVVHPEQLCALIATARTNIDIERSLRCVLRVVVAGMRQSLLSNQPSVHVPRSLEVPQTPKPQTTPKPTPTAQNA